jgi:hypothetical protein
MKQLILAAVLFLVAQAHANTECAGSATDGTFVDIQVNTTGAKGVPSGGTVRFEKGGNTYGYDFAAGDMVQYFEYDDQANPNSIVGMNAYVASESPIVVKYVGPNYVDMDLKAVLADGKVKGLVGNVIRVWQGPGRASTEQLQVNQLACSVWY